MGLGNPSLIGRGMKVELGMESTKLRILLMAEINKVYEICYIARNVVCKVASELGEKLVVTEGVERRVEGQSILWRLSWDRRHVKRRVSSVEPPLCG